MGAGGKRRGQSQGDIPPRLRDIDGLVTTLRVKDNNRLIFNQGAGYGLRMGAWHKRLVNLPVSDPNSTISHSHRFALILATAAMLLALDSIWMSFFLYPVFAQFTEDSLTVELSANGEARIIEEITPETTVPRIILFPVSQNVSNLLAVDESNVILRSVFTNNEIRIDTLGAAHVTLTYDAQIVNRTVDIWNVQYTGAIDSRVVLPPGSELLFVNSIPIDIVENVVLMPSGDVSLSYKTRGVTTDTFVVHYNGTEYNVGVLGISEVRDLSFDQSSKSIVLEVDSRQPILVMIPRNLLGGPYEVRAGNGQDVQFKEYYQNASHSWVRVEPASNTNSIRITGTTVIPEFQFSSFLVGISVSLLLFLSFAFGSKWAGFYKSKRVKS